MHISQAGLVRLREEIVHVLKRTKSIYCRALRRRVSLAKLPDALIKRHDAKRKLQCIKVAFDILRKSKDYKEKIINRNRCYEIYGKDASGHAIVVHIREEVHRKDRRLFFISCYQI